MLQLLAPSVTTVRDPKGQKFMAIVEAAYNKARLDDNEAQRVNDTPGLSKLIGSFIAESRVTDRYKDQQVPSTWTYPPEYKGPKDFHQQTEILLGILPGLDPEQAWKWYNDVYTRLEVPDWVEGVFAVPSEFALARLFYPDIQERPAQYCAGVNLLLKKIANSRQFYNYCDEQIDPAHLWRTERTALMINALWEMQGRPDIVALPAQLGLQHRGRSDLRARECFMAQEFGAGSLEGAAIALTHPERFVRWEQLHEDLAGDDFSSAADGQADEAPYLYFYDDKVKFGTVLLDIPNECYGSVSCWLPPQ